MSLLGGEALPNGAYNHDEEEKKEVLITPHEQTTSSSSLSMKNNIQCIERKLMEYIITEIELITTVIHQHLSRSIHSQHPHSLSHASSTSLSSSFTPYKATKTSHFFHNLLKHFTHTRRSVSLALSLSLSLNRYECIYPFCLVIKQNESPSSITAVSIHCITNLLNDPLFLTPTTPHIPQCIQCIGNTLCGVLLDVEQKEFDEGLLLKFMNLISCLLHHSCFIFLSEAMIWNLFHKLLYIYFNVNADHHSQALFEFAEITINLLVQKVFRRLPQWMVHEENARKVATRVVEVSSIPPQSASYVSLKDKILKSKKKRNTNTAHDDTTITASACTPPLLEAVEPFTIDCLVRILSALCCGDPCSYGEGETPQISSDGDKEEEVELNENRLIICLNLVLIALRESGEYFVRIPRILSLLTNNLCFILLRFGGATKYLMLYELCLRTHMQLLYKLREKMKLQNEMLFRVLFVRVLRYSLPQLLKREHSASSTDCLFNTDRVDDILSKQMDARPGLEAEEKAASIQWTAEQRRYDISSMSLMANDGSVGTTTANTNTVGSASSTSTKAHHRNNKNNNNNNRSEDHKESKFVVCALEHLVDLCGKPWFIAEMFVNYDCSLYSSNLCNDLISLLSQHTIPGTGVLLSKQYLALQCLVNITTAVNVNVNSNINRNVDMNELRRVQQRKSVLRRGMEIFNANPEKGIAYLYENGMFGRLIPREVFTKSMKKRNNSADSMRRQSVSQLIDSTDVVDQIVDILFYFPHCNDLRIGYYLGSEHILNEKVRNRYIERRYSFCGLSLDAAMRLFFCDFRLPVETQQVDRIVESFAAKYCADAGAEWKLSRSTTYTLCFALMMLHTNQHNESLKRDQQMKLEEFVNLVRMVKDAQHIAIELLESLYVSMTRNEIKLAHDTQSNNLSKMNWNLLIHRTQSSKYVFTSSDAIDRLNDEILNILFAPITTTFGLILDSNSLCACACDGDALIAMICNGFYHLALFISHCSCDCNGDENRMDLLILRLSQLSGLCEVGTGVHKEKALAYSESYGKKEISHLLFAIFYEFGANRLSLNGWNHMLHVVMQCARASLLPAMMYQLDDFVGGDAAGRPSNRGFKYLFEIDAYLLRQHVKQMARNKESSQEDQTLFGTISKFIDYFQISHDETLMRSERQKEEEKLIRSAQIILSDFCGIHLMMKKCAQFEIESVRCLMRALINNSHFGILDATNIEILRYNNDAYCVYIARGINDELIYVLQRSCLSVQFLTSVLLHNWRRIEFIWETIRRHLARLLDLDDAILNHTTANHNELHEAMVECAAISILKICVRALQLPCNPSTQCMMSLFELISSLSVHQFHRYQSVSYQITAALHRFIKQVSHKKKLYLAHTHPRAPSMLSLSASSSSSSSASASSIHSYSMQRERRHAKRLCDYKWWMVAPFHDIFRLIKTAATGTAAPVCDISAQIFVHILGVVDDNDHCNKLLFLQEENSDVLQPLMDTVMELLGIFIAHKHFRSDCRVKLMIINAIQNVMREMTHFYQLIITDGDTDENVAAPGHTNKKAVIFEYIVQILNYLITLCGSASCVIRSKALVALQHILLNMDENIDFMVSETILNMLCTRLIMIELTSSDSFEFITKSRVFALSLVNKYFLIHLDELRKVKTFKEIWMKILCCCDVMLEMKSDPNYNRLYVETKQNLKNVLKVMMSQKIIGDRDNNTWHKINDMFPRMKNELLCIDDNNIDLIPVMHPTPTPYSPPLQKQKQKDINMDRKRQQPQPQLQPHDIVLID